LAAFSAGLAVAVAARLPAASAAQPETNQPDLARTIDEMVLAEWIEDDTEFSRQQAESPGAAQPKITPAADAAGGCDGVKNGLWGFHVASGEKDPWWQVDLGKPHRIGRIVIYNRCDSASRTRDIRVLVAGADGDPGCKEFEQVYQHDGSVFYGAKPAKPLVVDLSEKDVSAQVVRLAIAGRCSFALDEVEVYGTENPKKNLALGKPADQISVSPYSWPGTMPEAAYARHGFSPLVEDKAAEGEEAGERFSLAHTGQILEQAERLADRLRPSADADELAAACKPLASLAARLEKLETAGSKEPQRKALYLEARRAKRAIAFCNPLLDIDKLLFIKRHDSVGVFHMCDQYYGCNAKPGGGLYVLHDPFGPEPRLEDVLADSVVERGRLKGQPLRGGAFLSPEVSFDGKTIFFAYSQAKAYEKYQGKTAYEWNPECSYHIFRCNADGSALVQLTDGPLNDFDPCQLPDGRIAFVSERRGGFLRCGRHCPTYTLFSMEPDGSDVVCLSFHETHEWHPSVTNDGMLVYTRWDYVDRDTNVAHHIWVCYPDGRDPRSYHGNYPKRRESRPWMEMSIRAIPGSHKFVAVTGAHHGHAFGSLVLIDQRIEDDGAESQLERITPEVPFPESEGRPIKNYMAYGTPWPLSEDDFLCVYDDDVQNRGIYWIDRHGNRELIYRDPEISCLSPMPLGPRPTPPVVPEQTVQTARAKKAAGGNVPPATIAVMNVYDSDFTWPEDTTIDALRIIQVLPKLTPSPNDPRIGVANQTNARAVLGTVPVEPDGSAFFKAPVGKLIYFQALDENGMAVQSMRSGTYVHPGERLNCQGCHEPKRRPPSTPDRVPLALRREPSAIAPEVEGSNPFNFVRLVQPVLDRHCVGCHQEKKALDLTGAVDPGKPFTRSYNNLAGKYGFYFHVSNGSINSGVHGGSRTIAGEFGARAAELTNYLGPEHYGVKLPEEDLRRIILWLDCNSEFLGAYEKVEEQVRGEVVHPSLE
jgi:hypothetical protein